ncbi:MAG: metal ABC transporter ATP-binding protein [Pseudomonadota bacterium]
MSSRLIEARGLTLKNGRATALRDVDLTVDRGEIVTIVGPNGSGKSTLLRGLIGALSPASGKITRAPGLRIGYVPQKLHLDQSMPMPVRRFLTLPLSKPAAAVEAALKAAGAESYGDRQMSALSGGQLQRVLLARAILDAPDLLILDEATQGLDQAGSAAFYNQIEDVRNTLDCGVLMVSHELHVVMAASDKVICLNGHVCCQGAPAQVASAPEYRALFGTGTGGALALYQHDHDHHHDHDHDHHHHDDAAPADAGAAR